MTIVNSEKARAVLDAAPTEPVPAPAASTDSRVGAPWTKEEDDLLRAAKGASRNSRWGEIAKAIPGRTWSGVRIRWQRLEEDARNKQRAEQAATAPVPVPVPVPAEAPVAEHKLLVDLPKDYAAGDRMKVMLINDENMLGQFTITIPKEAVPGKPIMGRFVLSAGMSAKGLRVVQQWKEGTDAPPLSASASLVTLRPLAPPLPPPAAIVTPPTVAPLVPPPETCTSVGNKRKLEELADAP